MTNKMAVVTGGDIETNCYIIHDGHDCILIDFIPDMPVVLDKLGLNVKAVFITHVHFDHFQMLSDYQKTHTFTLYLSELGLEHINDGLWTLTAVIPEALASKSMNVDVTHGVGLSDGEVTDILGMKIKTVYTPGHSKDSVCYIVEGENMVFVGDTIFRGGIGRTDLYGGDLTELVKSKRMLLNNLEDKTILYPGHGPETTVEAEITKKRV